MLNQDKIKLLKLLEEIGDVIIIDTTEKAFIQYFSTFDIHGVSNLLSDVHKFDSYSKTKYLEFINSFFQDLKDKGIENLSIYKGKCTNCLKGQGAITFTDKKSGLFIDLVLKIKDNEIIDITECYSVKNYSPFNKKKQLKITPGTDLRI
jgi:hypothetical protein